MARVLVTSERVDGIERSVSAEDLEQAYAHLTNCDLHRDLVLAEVAGTVVGYGRVAWRDEAGCRLYALTAFLAPEWRRKGIGGVLLGWSERRSGEIAAAHPPEIVKFLQANASQIQAGAAALLEGAGFRVERYFFEMVRPHLEEIPEWPLPAGIAVRPALPEHYPVIWRAGDETSRDEWGYTPATEEAYQEWLASPHFQPQLWQIAWDLATEQVVGQVLTYIDARENKAMGRQRGHTEGIGVVRAWRRRGLARALIGLSLRAQKAAGMSESALVADADSVSGVTRLYESCGFQIVQRNTLYRKPLI